MLVGSCTSRASNNFLQNIKFIQIIFKPKEVSLDQVIHALKNQFDEVNMEFPVLHVIFESHQFIFLL
jgi:hypothetical protein